MRITLLFVLFSFLTFAQDDIKDQYVHDFEKVYDAKAIHYYGIDFSNFGFYYPEKEGLELTFRKFFTEWRNAVHENLSVPDLEKMLTKSVKKDFQPVQSRDGLIRDEWITLEAYSFPTDTLQKIVKEYELTEKEGVGLVLIMESFNQKKEHARVNFTFFDIATREVLWSVESKGDTMGSQITKRWAKAIEYSFVPFKQAYRKSMREVKKSRK